MAVSCILAFLHFKRGSVLLKQWAPLRVWPCFFRPRSSRPESEGLSSRAENESLVENLATMGVDVPMARRRQPGVLRKAITNEKGLAHFLQSKGASRQAVAGIISRFPRSITRSEAHLEERWQLWRSIFKTDSEIIKILERSPESFFRSSDNDNLEKNILFLGSLGLNGKDLHRLLTTAPRTFSNSVELNRQTVELLQDLCVSLGGDEPEQFVKAVISRNMYILIRSGTRIKANVAFLRNELCLSDVELLSLLHGHGADILGLSTEYLKRNLTNTQEKLKGLGCKKSDVKKLIISYAPVLFVSPNNLNSKLDCLVEAGVHIRQIIEKPKILDFSLENLKRRIAELKKVDYDFKKNGIAILDSSQKRFKAKLERLTVTPEE